MPALPKNFARAVDLSALTQPKPATTPGAVLTVTSTNLVKDFLAASNKSVVVLLCWSPRSAQSQQVLDLLAKFHTADLATEGRSAWILGSVNVDAEPAVAQALQVQSVPLALAIIQEQLVPLFEAVPTEEQIRLVLDKVISLAAERGVGSVPSASDKSLPTEPEPEPEELQAMSALEKGDFEAAKLAYQSWSDRSPAEPLAKLGLAQTELFIRTKDKDAQQVYLEATAAPDDLVLQLLAADFELMYGQNELAFDRLINFIRSNSGDEKGKAKDHLIILFSLVDPSDPGLVKARQRLASALY
jgi:putative thioredoxin